MQFQSQKYVVFEATFFMDYINFNSQDVGLGDLLQFQSQQSAVFATAFFRYSTKSNSQDAGLGDLFMIFLAFIRMV